MISLTNRVQLPTGPERTWQCFCEMDAHYHEWIPEHLRWRWLAGEPLAPGTIWYADEWVGPMRLDARFQVIASAPARFFSWRILGFPAALVRAGGSFRFSPNGDDGCEMNQEVHFGFSVPILGSLLDLAIRVVLPLDEFRRHMREEGDNLAGVIASAT
jgi:hypothetical protein